MRDTAVDFEQFRAGSREAFRILVECYEGLVYQFLRNMVGRTADAEDLTQDVFLAAFRARATYDPRRGALSTWLLTIARNLCLNAARRPVSTWPGALEIPARDVAPDAAAIRNEIWAALDAALETLPRDQRAAFVLAEIQGLPLAEIARIEGVELGTVKSRVGRARERLRHILLQFHPASSSPCPVTSRRPP